MITHKQITYERWVRVKSIRNLLIVACLVLLLVSCSDFSNYVNFDFHPSIPYITRMEMFKTKVFINDDVDKNLGVGLIAGIDENSNKFVIIASIRFMDESKLPIDQLDFNVSSLLNYEKLEQLIQVVDASIKCWDLKQKETENVFYKFYVYPEHEEIRLSFNVIKFWGSFIYEYQNSINGSIAHIFLGDKIPYHKFVNEKQHLINFKNLLVEAKNYLDKIDENEILGT